MNSLMAVIMHEPRGGEKPISDLNILLELDFRNLLFGTSW